MATTTNLILVVAAAALATSTWFFLRARATSSSTAPPAQVVKPSAVATTQDNPGRAGIDAALDALYPNTRDHRMGLQAGPGETAPPLEEVVAYRSLTPMPHWHYITYGLSELGAKISDDAKQSGFGIELTLRLVDNSETPPQWPINLLRWLAGIVHRDKNPFGDGHSLPLLAHMLDKYSPRTDGVAFTLDSELGMVKTSNGSVKFLQVVPLTADEYSLMGRWDAVKVFEEMQSVEPGLLWRVGRTSILQGAHGPEIERRAKADGSAQEMDFDEVSWDEHTVLLDALSRQVVLKFLRYRLAYGRPASIKSVDKIMDLVNGPVALHLDNARAMLSVPAARAGALAERIEKAASNTVVTFDGVQLFRLGDMKELDVPFQR